MPTARIGGRISPASVMSFLRSKNFSLEATPVDDQSTTSSNAHLFPLGGIQRPAHLTWLLILLSSIGWAQTSVPANDQAASALAANAIVALIGNQPIHDVTLTGNIVLASGNDSGTATLKALGTSESRLDLALTAGTRTEIRDDSTGITQGEWITSTASGFFSFDNTLTDAVWFFPALGSLTSPSNVVLSYIAQESRNGKSVQHIRSYLYQPSAPPTMIGTPSFQQLSTMDFYLDATSYLPVALVFNQHPDNDASTNILVEIDYSDYQLVSGIQLPMRIQKLLNGAPLLDITLTSVNFNTGVSISDFAINQ